MYLTLTPFIFIKRVFPPWINGFDPVTVPPNQKVSFYIVNMGTGYGILGKYNSNNNRYFSPWVALDATSPVGSATMSIGRMGYNNEAFKVSMCSRSTNDLVVLLFCFVPLTSPCTNAALSKLLSRIWHLGGISVRDDAARKYPKPNCSAYTALHTRIDYN
jgi:hypothetical protein